MGKYRHSSTCCACVILQLSAELSLSVAVGHDIIHVPVKPFSS